MKNEKPLILLGRGGYASLLLDILLEQGTEILGFADKENASLEFQGDWYGIPCLGTDENVLQYKPEEVTLVNGLGSVASTLARQRVYEHFKQRGYYFRRVVHPFSYVSPRAVLGEGVHVLAGAVINIGAHVGENSIVNNRSAISHDCEIGAHVHIAPGCTLSGNVHVGDGCHIGAGATVVQGISIGSNVLVGAGALVLKDVCDEVRVWGIPAKEMKAT